MLLVMFFQHFISSVVGVCLLGTLGQMFVVCSCNVGRSFICWLKSVKFEDG